MFVLVVKETELLNTCILRLYVSATIILLLLWSYATAYGELNSPSLLPSLPSLNKNLPSLSKTCIMLLPSSATIILLLL
jgi:hypothetical protein